MFGRSSASTRDRKTTKNLYNVFFANIKGKVTKEKNKNIAQKQKKRDVASSSTEEVTHGGPI